MPVLGAIPIGLLRRGRAGIPWLAMGLGVLFASAVTLGWVWLVTRTVGDWFWHSLVGGQAVDRAVKAVSHPEPWYFYLAESPGLFAPWLFLLPGLLPLALSRQGQPSPGGREASIGTGLFLGAGILLFSLFPGKRTGYLLPLLPAVALLVANGLASYQAGAASHGWRWLVGATLALIAPVTRLAGGAVLLAAVLVVVLPPLVDSPVLQQIPGHSGLVGLVVGLALWRLAKSMTRLDRSASVALGGSFALALALLWGGAHLTVFPVVDLEKCRATFGQVVAETVPPNETLMLFETHLDGRVNLYTHRKQYEVVTAEDLEQAVEGHKELWLVADRDDWEQLPPLLRGRFREPAGQHEGNRPLVLLRKITTPR